MKKTVAALAIIFISTLLNAADTDIRLNSLGFLPDRDKRASIVSACAAFTVNRASDNSIAFSGTASGPVTNTDTGEPIYTADFSGLTETGNFYLLVPGVGQSPVFPIAADVYNNAFYMAMKGFYEWRCGTAVSYYYPRDGNTYSHAACHLQDGWMDYAGGGHTQKNGTMGWHDAGDYGKYLISGGNTVGMLLDAWFMFKDNFQPVPLDLPETAPGYPEFLKEMKWETDWFFKMQMYDGSSYCKLAEYGMPPLTVMPENNLAVRYFCVSGTAETAGFAASLAMMSRAVQPYDASYAAQCLAAASAAYANLTSTPVDYTPDLSNFGTITLTGVDFNSYRMWAAVEMWEATGDASALADFEARAAGYSPGFIDTDFDWQSNKDMAMFTYVLSARAGKNAGLLSSVESSLIAAADSIVATRNAHGYARPLGTVYYWGCNGTVARQAMILQIANRLSPNTAYLNTALDAIGYLYGRNIHDRSYVTGVGINPPMNPHHRPSIADGITNPWPGYLVGGSPGTNNNPILDPVVQSMPSGLYPPQYWVDNYDAYSANEVCTNWQGALVYALAGFVHPETPTYTPSASPTITGTPPTPTVTPSPTPFSGVIRVNCGGGQFTDTNTNVWLADQPYSPGSWGYTAGTAASVTYTISNTPDQALYQSERWGDLSYLFDVPDGDYRVLLKFAEFYWTTPGSRIFSVTLDGNTVISGLDLFATAGFCAAYDRSFDVSVTGGQLNMTLSSGVNYGKISAIQLLLLTPTATPIITATPTATAEMSFTQTATQTPQSATPTQTPTQTRAESATDTPTATPTIRVQPDGLVVYPNPCSNTLNLSFGDTQDADRVEISLYTEGFRLVMRQTTAVNPANLYSLDVSKLGNGLYIVSARLFKDKTLIMGKIMPVVRLE